MPIPSSTIATQQRFPPADELKKRGIKNVLYLVPNEARKEELDDLNDEFVDWQKNGIEVRMLQLDDFKPYDENVTTTNAAGAPVVAPERHYYYGGSPLMHRRFFSHYMYRPYPTVFVTRGGRNVPLGRPPVATSPPPSTRAQSYRPDLDQPCSLLRVLAVLAESEGTGQADWEVQRACFRRTSHWNTGRTIRVVGAEQRVVWRVGSGQAEAFS